MKPNRSRITIISMAVLALFAGFLLCSCATTGEGKEAEPGGESPGQVEKQDTAVGGTGGSSADTSAGSVATTKGSGGNLSVQTSSPGDGESTIRNSAAYLLQTLERILPEKMTELNWNRIATVVVGLLFMGAIYGLALAIGRLPARRRVAGQRGGSEPSG